MAKVVCVHGIAQEYEVEDSLLTDWAPRLCGGVKLAGGTLAPKDVRLAFYGHLFRPPGAKSGSIPNFSPGDVEEGIEMEVLNEWATELEATQELTATVESKGQFTQRSSATMLQLLGATPLLGQVGQRFVIWYLKQVRRYLKDPTIRQQARQSLLDVTTDDTRVYVAHSLGSIVAYEVLSAHHDLPVRTLVTVGSPLGVKAIHSRLDPPVIGGKGTRPSQLQSWTNIADKTDLVALVKRLTPIFGNVSDVTVHNGATMHDIRPYLTAVETGQAVAAGLNV